ncbi:hypothetical protein ABH926_000966 [Catenulispora sp. GP43]|uniref:transposase family protein n=1 Tax=Catenulispora sp. GP43 TaxID=3156263 RepID=UPI0035113034
MAGGNGVSASTVRRWVLETIALLAAKAPRLDRALAAITRSGGEVVLIDLTLVRTRRRTGKQNRRNYSGKHKAHGLLFLAITDERGNLLWISAAKPGRASDLTAARHNKICAKLRAAGLGAIGDLGFTALDDDPDNPVIITGKRRARKKPLRWRQRCCGSAAGPEVPGCLWATEVVEAHLAAQWMAHSPEMREVLGPPMVIIDVKAHEFGWLVVCQSQRYAETRDFRDLLIGHGPFLVDGLDGSLHMVHPQFGAEGNEWEDQYRAKVRSQVKPRELDVRIRELLQAGRRFEALRAARQAGEGFGPADAKRFVDAIGSEHEPPADLVARLPQPDREFRAVTTFSGPNPESANAAGNRAVTCGQPRA